MSAAGRSARRSGMASVPVGAVHGEIDASNVRRGRRRAARARVQPEHGARHRPSETTYLDSAGINLLFALRDELRSRQLTLRLVIPPATSISRMLTITGLDRVCPSYATLAEAVSA